MCVLSDDLAQRWLRTLAADVLEHRGCYGCKCNAAQALDELGLLNDVLSELVMPDPRETGPPGHWRDGNGALLPNA